MENKSQRFTKNRYLNRKELTKHLKIKKRPYESSGIIFKTELISCLTLEVHKGLFYLFRKSKLFLLNGVDVN